VCSTLTPPPILQLEPAVRELVLGRGGPHPRGHKGIQLRGWAGGVGAIPWVAGGGQEPAGV
jgi:hypothetical protein